MAYKAIAQRDRDADDTSSHSSSPRPARASPRLARDAARSSVLFTGQSDEYENYGSMEENNADGLGLTAFPPSHGCSQGRKNYYRLSDPHDTILSSRASSSSLTGSTGAVAAHRDHSSELQGAPGAFVPPVTNCSTQHKRQSRQQPQQPKQRKPPPIVVPQPIRTSSGRSPRLRHPTPDLHILQGAYMANVEHLEKTAERLSMTSSIEDAIHQLHNEQKRADSSRRSSLLSSPTDMPAVTRQFSNPASIVEVNNAARSGGYSPGGYNMLSPRSSFSAGNPSRSVSKGPKYGTRPEPELEGRPLDSFVNVTSSMLKSPVLSRSASIAEQEEETSTIIPNITETVAGPQEIQNTIVQDDRPTTSASVNTFEQAQTMFKDFDGEHFSPRSREPSGNGPSTERDISARNNRASMARPQSYADPGTGQQMVFYPAPVPTMLNLPQKLSKLPSSNARDKTRSQILSTMVPTARQSTAWLPDVLESEDDPQAAEDTHMLQETNHAQGGQRHSVALGSPLGSPMPPQLRASAFFEHSGMGIDHVVEVKGESAVATLDSILDASAFAPVNAFTDHSFAGHLGAEVYGHAEKRASQVEHSVQTSNKLQKRKSISTLLTRNSSSDMLADRLNQSRGGTPSNSKGIRQFRSSSAFGLDAGADVHSDDGDSDDGLLDEGQLDDHLETVEYHGAPTTLLAELQLRKQQQKQRTKPIHSMYPNGVHSTLMELDAVAQVEKKYRQSKRVTLAWEDPALAAGAADADSDADEDIPLGILYQTKAKSMVDLSRPLGLMEKRRMEENEPLSRRRDRLQGRVAGLPRASTQGISATDLPPARRVSGDFTTELISQFGGDLLDGGKQDTGEDTAAPAQEEEETLGQRRKRLQAEREARAKEVGGPTDQRNVSNQRPGLKQRHSMADILQAHPTATGRPITSHHVRRPSGGLLGLHEQQSMQRSSTMQNLGNTRPPMIHSQSYGQAYGMKNSISYNNMAAFPPSIYGMQNNNAAFQNDQRPMLPPMPFQTQGIYGAQPAAANTGGIYNNNNMAASMLQLQLQMEQLSQAMGNTMNQGQSERVERWRQSVMH